MVRHESKTMIAMAVNRRLAAARALAGLTQRELARRVGTREIEISRIETGRVCPGEDVKRRIAEALQKPALELFDAQRRLMETQTSESGKVKLEVAASPWPSAPEAVRVREALAGAVAVEGLINKAEAARRLSCGLRTLDTWMRRGIVPYYKISKKVAFKWSEIEAVLERNCHVNRGGWKV
jgi:transcriptional regulator with XRE-family HTH domain